MSAPSGGVNHVRTETQKQASPCLQLIGCDKAPKIAAFVWRYSLTDDKSEITINCYRISSRSKFVTFVEAGENLESIFSKNCLYPQMLPMDHA